MIVLATGLAMPPMAAWAAGGASATAGWSPDLLCVLAACLLVVFGLAMVATAFLGEAVEFSLRRHEGGFGAGAVGWRLSPPLAQLGAGLLMVVLAIVLAAARMPVASDDAKAGKGEKAEAAASAASAAH